MFNTYNNIPPTEKYNPHELGSLAAIAWRPIDTAWVNNT